MAGTSVFLKRMFVQFLVRQSPDSTVAKPRCIRNTSMPPIRIQMLLIVKSASAACEIGAGSAASAAPRGSAAAKSAGTIANFQ